MNTLNKIILLAFLAGAAGPLLCADVSFKESSIVLPTYAPGGYDKTPIFYTGRVYQGAQGRVYPYPMQDVLHDEKVDETYKYLTLENDWLQMGLLPEHGGHLLNLTDKQTGFETFYRQHVIKPALIGMLGAWISGGVEWNFPHHHRATTAMPIDWSHMSNADGLETVWIGETEMRRPLKWTIGLSMMKDRAVLQAENVFMNRQNLIESMIYWANVSVHCGDDYQVIFPPSCHLGFDHHKNFWTSFPMGPKKVDHDWVPSQRSKWAEDVEGMIDLGWWKNFTVESRSIFAMDPDNAWLAGYDHKRNMGTAHVSNRHLTVGKKFFLWGNFPEAHVWDTVLTDHDGPYLELMVGCWSDNQPDYSWIAPYETRTVKQFWFPVKGIGGVKNVTIDGAVNLERRGEDEMLIGFHSTRVLKNCTVRLTEGGKEIFSAKTDIDPNTPWCRAIKVAKGVKDQAYTASIADEGGKEFLSYTPVPEDPHDPLPPKVANPKEPGEYTSAELAYLTGLRLDQFHNGLIDPVPYYERALEIDPDYSAANVALGIRLVKGGEFSRAEKYLRRAADRVNQNYMRAKDVEPEYYLAIAYLGLARTSQASQTYLKKAEDLFWRVTWRATLKKEAFAEIVRLRLLTGRLDEARDVLECYALPMGQDVAKFHALHAYILRKSGETVAASAALDRAVKCDPLEYLGVVERAFLAGRNASDAIAAAERTASGQGDRGLKAQQLMECICDYYGIGAWDEVIALCDAALAKAAAEKPYRTEGTLPLKETLAACNSYKNPMFGYFKAYAAAQGKKVKGEKVEGMLDFAGSMVGDYCFPSRLEELAVLQWAAEEKGYTKKDALANTHYYLGEILWNLDQKDAAKASWQVATHLNPRHALAWRCLGFALAHPGTYFTNTGVPTGVPNREAYDCYLKAVAADPENFRTLEEMDKLAEKLDIPAAERLAVMEKHRKTAEKYDACILRMTYLYNEVGNYDAALDILTSRKFHVWEGSEGLLTPFIEALLARGQLKMSAGDQKGALADFERSLTYPENLQAGRPGDAGIGPKSYYFIAQCKKALGDKAGFDAAMKMVFDGWIHPGEMNYWRARALKELGRTDGLKENIAELRKAIETLEKPQPKVIDAYAKFGGENTPMERAAKNAKKAAALRKLLNELELERNDK